MKWYIGQRIVAIKDHMDLLFKKGQEFIVLGIREGICNCRVIDLDIGLRVPLSHSVMECFSCKGEFDDYGNINWQDEREFAPIDELCDHTIESIIEELEIITVKPQTVEI